MRSPGAEQIIFDVEELNINCASGEDAYFLAFIHQRLKHHHGELHYYDYMWRLRGIINRIAILDGISQPGEYKGIGL